MADGSALPSWLNFDAVTQTFSGTPLNDDVGDIDVVVTANDNNGGTVSDTFALTVTNTNDAPITLQEIDDQTIAEDSLFSFVVPTNTFGDVDGDTLSLSATLADGSLLPSWLTFDAATQTFSGMPLNSDVGNVDVIVTANDNDGGTISDTFALSVTNTNDAPITSIAISDQAIAEDSLFSFVLPTNTFSDGDGDTLLLSATLADGSLLPSWLTFDAVTQTFSGTPLNSDVGDVDVIVTANDNNGGTVSDTFALSVTNTNDAPVAVMALSNQQIAEGSLLEWQLPEAVFVDADIGDSLQYQIMLESGEALPTWLQFDVNSQQLAGIPPSDASGTLSLQLIATDLQGASSAQVFDLIIDEVADIAGDVGNDTLVGDTTNNRIFGNLGPA